MATRTPEERKARDWLLGLSTSDYPHERETAITLLTMLSRPTLPEEPTDKALTAMTIAYQAATHASMFECMKPVYRALYAHLTKPKTKEVDIEGWAVVGPDGYVGVFQRTKQEAETWLWRCHEGSKVVRVTGKATVPA